MFITRRGQYEKDGVTFSDGNQTHLLHGEKDFEAIVEIMPKGTIGCYYSMPGTDLEFNYILRGAIELMDGGETVLLSIGDTYSHHVLTQNVMFRVIEDAEILGINTSPYYDTYQQSHQQLNEILDQLQAVDGDTLNHCTRVKELSMGIAYYLRYNDGPLLDLFYAAKFHDVGKSKVPVEILLKPGRLTAEEYEVMKTHSRSTYEMIREFYGERVATIAFEHHEHLDGKGYPRGLHGDQISLAARIICVADAYDAMVVTRPYHTGLSREAALAELRRCQGSQFDSTVVDALETYLAEQ